MSRELGKLVVAIQEGALHRGVELDEDQLLGYTRALREYNPDDVLAALVELWSTAESRAMPLPREITERIGGRRRRAREQVIRSRDGYLTHRPVTLHERKLVEQIVAAEREYTLGRSSYRSLSTAVTELLAETSGPPRIAPGEEDDL